MISMEKKYTTRSGLPVRVLCLDRKEEFPVLALVEEGEREAAHAFTAGGSFYAEEGRECQLDLVEVLPYADFKIDDPVMVRTSVRDDWQKRHFAGVNKFGMPTTWTDGRTSFTVYSEGSKMSWGECRRPTSEELGQA